MVQAYWTGAIALFSLIPSETSLRTALGFVVPAAYSGLPTSRLMHRHFCVGREGPSMNLRLAANNHPHQCRVAFQGEGGAYSEKSLRELLGPDVVAVAEESFEDTFKAVARREVDYAVIPIENSLGGSIHANYDLLLRYELFIVAEHVFRVEHCLLALPGTKLSDVKKVMSHPQALAQCDNYLRGLGVEKTPTYDTAGSAKMISEGKLKDCAAIASDLAAEAYGMDVLARNIEDDDANFTRFLLLGRQPVGVHLSPDIPSKTSVVFTLPNSAGALYKALACFSLREIDCSKIESRPTSAQLLQFLRFQQRGVSSNGRGSSREQNGKDSQGEIPRFQYCFYLDFQAAELDDRAQSALAHLRELTPFTCVLGSYPRDSMLVGPVQSSLEALRRGKRDETPEEGADPAEVKPMRELAPRGGSADTRLKIGIVGFGKFGQFIAKGFVKKHDVFAMSRGDYSMAARDIGATYYPQFESSEFFANDLDVVVLAVSILSFEDVLKSIPPDSLRDKLVVDVLSVKIHAKQVMLNNLPASADILGLTLLGLDPTGCWLKDDDQNYYPIIYEHLRNKCTHPMFGPESGAAGWAGLPFLYDRVRILDHRRVGDFLAIWESERCKMVEMSCELHDKYAANTQFITHLMGRILGKQGLSRTPIDTQGFSSAMRLMETTCADSFELFYGLFRYNPHSNEQLRRLRESFAEVERQLAAKEAYLAAKAETADEDRRRMLAEFRTIIKEAAASAAEAATDRVTAAKFGAAGQAALLASEGAPPPKSSNGVGIDGSHASTTRDLHAD